VDGRCELGIMGQDTRGDEEYPNERGDDAVDDITTGAAANSYISNEQRSATNEDYGTDLWLGRSKSPQLPRQPSLDQG
jgi:hypothetical protein